MTDERRRAVITGRGPLCGLGDSSDAVWAALVAGTRTVGTIKDFDAARYLGADKNYRPLDRLGRLTAVAVALALADAGRPDDGHTPLGLVLGTMFGGMRTIMEFDRRALTEGVEYVKPLDFANTVLNAAGGQAAIWHKLRGVNATLAGGTTSGLAAVSYATDLVRTSQADALLAGGAEELCPEALLGFEKAGLVDVALAEAACLFMVEAADCARKRGATILAEVSGSGSAFGEGALEQVLPPFASLTTLERAVRAALDDASLAPSDVGAVSLSANGLASVEQSEAIALEHVFGSRATELPRLAVKSQLGESLGAGGAFQTLGLLEAMRRGVLPAAREARIDHGLVTSMGLDGQAVALVLSRASG